MEAGELERMIQGANVLACAAIAVFFTRSWRRSGDSFFLLFALAFFTFAANRLAIALTDEGKEALGQYVVRLAAFLLIAIAVVIKNRKAGGTFPE